MTKRKANHVIDGMNAAKSQGNGAGYIENDQLVLTEEQKQNNKKSRRARFNKTAFACSDVPAGAATCVSGSLLPSTQTRHQYYSLFYCRT